MFRLFTGEIDVSIGATVGFTAAVTREECSKRDVHPFSSAFVAILVGVVIGIINAIGIILFKSLQLL